MENTRSTYMMDAHAELSVLIASLSEESRVKVFAFFDRKMSSSYRNGRKAGLASRRCEADRFGSNHGKGIALSVFNGRRDGGCFSVAGRDAGSARRNAPPNFFLPPRTYVHFVTFCYLQI
jgi:hypothetical protein